MTDQQYRFLSHAAEGRLLFHTGLWGGPAGYRWCGPNGDEAGRVCPGEAELLDQLVFRGMLHIEPQPGPAYRRVMLTVKGRATLSATMPYAA